MDEIRDPQYKNAEGSALRVWRDTAKNNFLSEKEGRPVFDEVIYVEVISPGSRDSTPTFEAVRLFNEKSDHAGTPVYGPKYAEFKQYIDDFEKSETADASLSGTPLAQWSELPRTMVSAMREQKIFTVDALASLPDTKLNAVGPDGRAWREKAKAYIESAKNAAYSTSLAADLERTKIELADTQERMKAMAAQMEAMQAAQAGNGAAPTAAQARAAAKAAEAAEANRAAEAEAVAKAAASLSLSPALDPVTGEVLVSASPII